MKAGKKPKDNAKKNYFFLDSLVCIFLFCIYMCICVCINIFFPDHLTMLQISWPFTPGYFSVYFLRTGMLFTYTAVTVS